METVIDCGYAPAVQHKKQTFPEELDCGFSASCAPAEVNDIEDEDESVEDEPRPKPTNRTKRK